MCHGCTKSLIAPFLRYRNQERCTTLRADISQGGAGQQQPRLAPQPALQVTRVLKALLLVILPFQFLMLTLSEMLLFVISPFRRAG